MTHAGRSILAAALLITLIPVARAEVVSNISMPFSGDFIVPCANGGAGEIVSVQGQVHQLFALTADRKGGFHVKILTNAQGVSGYGQSTGERYQVTGAEATHLSLRGPFPQTLTTADSFHVIGQSAGGNLSARTVVHVTVNANGDPVVDTFSNTLVCR